MLGEKLVTAEEFEAMYEPGCRLDLVRGEVLRLTNAGWWHGAVAAIVCQLLQNHVRARGCGMVFAAETGFLLERGPDTVQSPDAAFVRTGGCGTSRAAGTCRERRISWSRSRRRTTR